MIFLLGDGVIGLAGAFVLYTNDKPFGALSEMVEA